MAISEDPTVDIKYGEEKIEVTQEQIANMMFYYDVYPVLEKRIDFQEARITNLEIKLIDSESSKGRWQGIAIGAGTVAILNILINVLIQVFR